MCVRGVGAVVFVRGRVRVALGLGCARAAFLVAFEVVGVRGRAPLALELSVGAICVPARGCASVCARARVYVRVCVHARCVRNVVYFSMSLKIVLMKRQISQGDHNQ